MTYTAARETLAATMNQVCENHEPVMITRNRSQTVVMMSLEDYNSLEETAYLMRSPANAGRLLEAIAQMKKGDVVKKTLRDLAE